MTSINFWSFCPKFVYKTQALVEGISREVLTIVVSLTSIQYRKQQAFIMLAV